MPDRAAPARGCLAVATALVAMLAAPSGAQTLNERLAACSACHGPDGNSAMAGSPSLAGQPPVFLETQLIMIREGLRDVPPAMKGTLDGFKDEEVTQIARYYAKQPLRPAAGSADPDRVRRGGELSKRLLCGTCHLPGYEGRDQIPRLAGQREDYLLHAMKQFRDGKVTGRDTMMISVLKGLSDSELADLSHYFATFRK